MSDLDELRAHNAKVKDTLLRVLGRKHAHRDLPELATMAADLIHEIETSCDPASEKRTTIELRQNVDALSTKVQELEREAKDARRAAWVLIESAGGEVKIAGELIDDMPADATIHRSNDLATRSVVFKSSPSIHQERRQAELDAAMMSGDGA